MKFANAINLNRKSGGAKPTRPGVPWRDLQFHGPLLETRNPTFNRIVISPAPACRGTGT